MGGGGGGGGMLKFRVDRRIIHFPDLATCIHLIIFGEYQLNYSKALEKKNEMAYKCKINLAERPYVNHKTLLNAVPQEPIN